MTDHRHLLAFGAEDITCLLLNSAALVNNAALFNLPVRLSFLITRRLSLKSKNFEG